MTLREAAQQALEALEKCIKHLPVHFDSHFEAITALRTALAEPVQEPVARAVCDTSNLMFFHSICTKQKCYVGTIKVFGPGADDFEVIKLEGYLNRIWTDVLAVTTPEEMDELRVELRKFKQHPEWFEEEVE